MTLHLYHQQANSLIYPNMTFVCSPYILKTGEDMNTLIEKMLTGISDLVIFPVVPPSTKTMTPWKMAVKVMAVKVMAR